MIIILIRLQQRSVLVPSKTYCNMKFGVLFRFIASNDEGFQLQNGSKPPEIATHDQMKYR